MTRSGDLISNPILTTSLLRGLRHLLSLGLGICMREMGVIGPAWGLRWDWGPPASILPAPSYLDSPHALLDSLRTLTPACH